MLTFQRRRGIVSKQRKYEVKRCPGFFPAPPTLTRFEMRAVVEEVLHTRDLIATSAENLHPFTAHKNFCQLPENHSLSSKILLYLYIISQAVPTEEGLLPSSSDRKTFEWDGIWFFSDFVSLLNISHYMSCISGIFIFILWINCFHNLLLKIQRKYRGFYAISCKCTELSLPLCNLLPWTN